MSFLSTGPGKSVSIVCSSISALITRGFVTRPSLAPHHLCWGYGVSKRLMCLRYQAAGKMVIYC